MSADVASTCAAAGWTAGTAAPSKAARLRTATALRLTDLALLPEFLADVGTNGDRSWLSDWFTVESFL
jgi:hypothetical protein